jgi:hypothetical protein
MAAAAAPAQGRVVCEQPADGRQMMC